MSKKSFLHTYIEKVFIKSFQDSSDHNSWKDSVIAIWPSITGNESYSKKIIKEKYGVQIPKHTSEAKKKAYEEVLSDFFFQTLDAYVNDYVDVNCPGKLSSIRKWAISRLSEGAYLRKLHANSSS